MYKFRGIPGLRRKRLTRATARRPHNPVARLSAAPAGEKPRRCINPGVSPGCGVNALPGLQPADRPPVALLSAARAGEKPRRRINPGVSPGCGVNALPGLHSPQTAHPRSLAKRSASRGETASMYESRGIPGLRRKRLTRATARRPPPRSTAKRGASRGETASTHKSRGIPGLRRKRLTRATQPADRTPP